MISLQKYFKKINKITVFTYKKIIRRILKLTGPVMYTNLTTIIPSQNSRKKQPIRCLAQWDHVLSRLRNGLRIGYFHFTFVWFFAASYRILAGQNFSTYLTNVRVVFVFKSYTLFATEKNVRLKFRQVEIKFFLRARIFDIRCSQVSTANKLCVFHAPPTFSRVWSRRDEIIHQLLLHYSTGQSARPNFPSKNI